MVSDLKSITADANGRVSKIVINYLVIGRNDFREGSLDIAGYFKNGDLSSYRVIDSGVNEFQKRRFLDEYREYIGDELWHEYKRFDGNPTAILAQEGYGVDVEMLSARRGSCRCTSVKRKTPRRK